MNTPWRQPTAPWPPPPPCARVLPLICFSRCLRTTNALNLCAPRGFSPWPAPPPCAPGLPLSLLFSVSPWLCGEYSLGCGYAALCLCTTNALSLCMPRGSSPWPPPPPCAPVLPLSLLFSVSPWLCGEYSLGCGYAALCLCTTNALSLCMPRGSSPWPPPPPCASVLPLSLLFSVSPWLLRNKMEDCWKQRACRGRRGPPFCFFPHQTGPPVQMLCGEHS